MNTLKLNGFFQQIMHSEEKVRERSRKLRARMFVVSTISNNFVAISGSTANEVWIISLFSIPMFW